ncbi:hypothetical protein ZIOFF_054202 [Zingiber officinale]|uniref:Uncharacterized protein n=1 Tax=Zingiber officinale TaxID=94328 RepID=A0A8J5F938_ZINOF|nr:hypothetical protein ZIOFF_054202 [Zingiber officinale]
MQSPRSFPNSKTASRQSLTPNPSASPLKCLIPPPHPLPARNALKVSILMALDIFFPARFFLDNTASRSLVVSISLFVSVLCLCIVIGHLFEENRWINESLTAIVIIDLKTKEEYVCGNATKVYNVKEDLKG